MLRERLASNAIVSAGYDAATRELELEFRSGHVYRYEGVPASVHGWLLRTKNKGGFVRRMITGRYPERPVTPGSVVPGAVVPGSADGSGVEPEAPSLEEALRASLEQLSKPSG